MALRVFSPYKDIILSSLEFQGYSNDCGPFTTATVLNALRGINIIPELLAREMDKPVWRGPLFIVRRVPRWATFPWGMVDIFNQYGLSANWRLFASKSYLRTALSDRLVLMPIIGSIIPLWAHVMSLVAWDESKGWGFANTQFTHQNIQWLSEEIFTKQWRTMANMIVEVNNA